MHVSTMLLYLVTRGGPGKVVDLRLSVESVTDTVKLYERNKSVEKRRMVLWEAMNEGENRLRLIVFQMKKWLIGTIFHLRQKMNRFIMDQILISKNR